MSSTTLPFELVALEKAVRYQAWIVHTIQPFLGQRILELGAGIGNLSRWMAHKERLILTDRDTQLLSVLTRRLPTFAQDIAHISTHQLNLDDDSLSQFNEEAIDTIISFNVLEHIEDDAELLAKCAALLRTNLDRKKRIITFVPAHQWAYGAMDKALEHHRRYDRKKFQQLHQKIAPEAQLTLLPFNVVGLFGWYLNGCVMKKKSAGMTLIQLVELLCPIFKLTDKVLHQYLKISIGQSLIAIQEFSPKNR